MSAPTTAPGVPDAVLRDIAAVLEARRDAADGKTYYADTWPTIDKLRATIAAAIAEAEARGRAAALAEVDAALEALDGPNDRVCGDFIAGRISTKTVYATLAGPRPAPGDTWWASGNGPDSFGPTPTAAILAAAAALAGGDE